MVSEAAHWRPRAARHVTSGMAIGSVGLAVEPNQKFKLGFVDKRNELSIGGGVESAALGYSFCGDHMAFQAASYERIAGQTEGVVAQPIRPMTYLGPDREIDNDPYAFLRSSYC